MSDGNTPTEHLGKSSRGRLGALIAVILLPILAYGTIKFLQRPDHKPTFHAQVTVDVEVNGQPVHIERVITCQTFATGDSIQISLLNFWKTLTSRRETQWISIPRAFGEVLPDGSALMVRTPYFCGYHLIGNPNDASSYAIQDSATNRTPIVGWTPDAKKAETIEFYMSDAFKTAPGARFKNFSIETKLVEDRKASPIDQFAWFSGLYHPEALRKGPDENGNYPEDMFWGVPAKEKRSIVTIGYKGYAGWRLEHAEWRGKVEGLDALLEGMTKPAALPSGEFDWKIREIAQQRFGPERTNIRAVVVPQQRWGGLRSSHTSWSRAAQEGMSLHPGLRDMLSFPVIENEVWLDGPLPKGYIILHREHLSDEEKRQLTLHESNKLAPPMVFHLGGQTFDQPRFTTKAFFDPSTQQLFFAEAHYFGARVPPDNPLVDP
ncbi:MULTISPECIES: hypothetical protein [Kordiimonas]|jgi:hypothetical protein|uniref:hypothetical protein n=1 Tax=Kordiimonas TaxID=288021 RepID=UPI00257BBC18|nr:hypothetical protein [Kordiimonas sp. UBA4487]